VWKNRCAATQRRIGGHSALVLSRWDASEPPEIWNLVLLTQAEAAKLEEIGQTAFPPEVAASITAKLGWAKRFLNYDESCTPFTEGQGPTIEHRCIKCQRKNCQCVVEMATSNIFYALCSFGGVFIGFALSKFVRF
jgi:hypothetical protein